MLVLPHVSTEYPVAMAMVTKYSRWQYMCPPQHGTRQSLKCATQFSAYIVIKIFCHIQHANLVYTCPDLYIGWVFIFLSSSGGEEWKRIRSAAKKQIIPRRVGNFTPTLSNFAEQFGNHLYSIRSPEGYVMDVQAQVMKYAFQSEIQPQWHYTQLQMFHASSNEVLANL